MSASSAADLKVRHRPVQQRGLQRFDTILAAARELLVDRGLDGFTVEDLAAHAGIPVGSIYQFFPNKHAIVAELDSLDTQELVAELDSAAARFPAPNWLDEVDDIIDLIARHWVDAPSRRAVWLAMESAASTRILAADHTQHLVAALLPIVSHLPAQLTPEQCRTVTQVVVEMCRSLLHFSVSAGEPDTATVTELKRVLRAYLRAVVVGP